MMVLPGMIKGKYHADKHAMAFAGASDYWLATDGGLYQTSSDASVWNDGEDINSAQFYHIDQNPHEPECTGAECRTMAPAEEAT